MYVMSASTVIPLLAACAADCVREALCPAGSADQTWSEWTVAGPSTWSGGGGRVL